MKLRPTLTACLSLLTILTAPGCMLGPYNGQRVESKDSSISFWGYHLLSEAPVSILAYDAEVGEWEEIGFTVSSPNVALVAMDGNPLYEWSLELVVPEYYWEPGVAGLRVAVAAVSEDFNLMSVEEDWLECYAHSASLPEFQTNCSAEQSPVAWVYTVDYVAPSSPSTLPTPLPTLPTPLP